MQELTQEYAQAEERLQELLREWEELPMPRRKIIGLTGNIATGKSAVMRLAADHGALDD
ncbi:MAG: hypothetical protein R3C44_21075 [Chloroflexota bacterium]